jgi:hypothetical protein
VKLSKGEHETLEARAKAENETLSQLVRRELLAGVVVSAQEHRIMEFLVIGEEKLRLRLEAAQSGVDIRLPAVREEIENEAILAAASIVERRLQILAGKSVEVAA